MASPSREFVPVRVVAVPDWANYDTRIRVEFLCEDGVLCIPFEVDLDSHRSNFKGGTPTLPLTVQELKKRLYASLQRQEAKEILKG